MGAEIEELLSPIFSSSGAAARAGGGPSRLTVFAYGQTGSGKTYTMGALTEAVLGRLLDAATGVSATGRQARLGLSYYEIYMAKPYDLLNGAPHTHLLPPQSCYHTNRLSPCVAQAGRLARRKRTAAASARSPACRRCLYVEFACKYLHTNRAHIYTINLCMQIASHMCCTEQVPLEIPVEGDAEDDGTFSQNYGGLLTMILALYSPTVVMLVRQEGKPRLPSRRRWSCSSRGQDRAPRLLTAYTMRPLARTRSSRCACGWVRRGPGPGTPRRLCR